MRILWASALCAISPSPAAAQTDLLSKDTITIEGDLRTIAVGGEPSWIDGSFGKLRFGPDGSETVKLRLAEADLAWKPRLGWNLTGLVSIVHQAGQDRDVDLNEAFFRFKPVPTGNTHYSARIGLMYPPISLEHGGPNWTVTNSITPSAINSWISEEVKIVAAEATIDHDFGGHDISITGAAFGFNDTSGTLLSYRGWALHDVKATTFGHLPLPPLDAEIALDQVQHSNTINEIDHRIGYYVRLDWHPPLPVSLYAFYYDNRGDGISARKLQESWNTKFLNIGATAHLAGDFKIMSQAMWGHTLVGVENPAAIAVDVRYFSAYAMGVKEIGQGTISGRIEAFRTTDRGVIEPLEYSENGWATMIAYKRPLTQNINLVVEALHVGSDRDGRVEYGGVAARQSQTQVQSSLRVKF